MAAAAAAGALRRCWRPLWRSASVSPGCHGLGGAVRGIRTGFFPEDEDYIDPEGPLLADRINSRWRYMDDASLGSTVLERSNVGMGMLVLNREKGLDLPTINDAYVRLRNLEVNSFKRFVGLAAMEPGPFCAGLDKMELLLIATCTRFHKLFPPFGRALLWHSQELAHLVADYRKPVVCHVSGTAANSGAALACLASHCGVHEGSEMVVDACSVGLVPDGGMTHVLGSLRWNLGEFLALTGWRLRGADLVYCGLARHWLAPEALPFLELTAEKQLEVSEADARALLDEHSLPLPDGMRDIDSLPRRLVPLISEIFGKLTVKQIAQELDQQAGEMDDHVAERLQDAVRTLQQNPVEHGFIPPDVAANESLRIVDLKEKVRQVIDNVLRVEKDVELFLDDLGRNWRPSAPLSEASITEVSERVAQITQQIEFRYERLIQRGKEAAVPAQGVLQNALGSTELLQDAQESEKIRRWLKNLLPEQTEGILRKARKSVVERVDLFKDAAMQKIFVEVCRQRMGQASPLALCATLALIRGARAREAALNSGKQAGKLHPGALLESLEMEMRVLQRLLSTQDVVLGLHARCMGVQHTEWSRALEEIEEENDVKPLMSPLNPGIGKVTDLAIHPRPDLPLSRHPRLRRYHPDFDPKTGLDHDPAWMAAEAQRWSRDFLAGPREAAVRELLGWSRSGSKDPASCGLSRFTRVES